MSSDYRYTAIFAAALLTASSATFAVYRMLGTARTPQHESVRSVVVAVRDVPVGVPVPREALGVASWPLRVAPPESYLVADSVVGRVTRAPLMPGEPVLASRLAVRGAAPGLEGAIDPTRRAMAVRVNEAASVSGLVRANSRVDVLMAGRGDGTQATARVLMSDVRVLGVGSVRPPDPASTGTAPDPAPSATTAAIVTLEVTPTQAEELAAAEGQGAIQVVLRGYGSTGAVGPALGATSAIDETPGAVNGAPVILGASGAVPAGMRMLPPGTARTMAAGGGSLMASHAARATNVRHRPVRTPGDVAAAPTRIAVDAPATRAHAESTTVHVYRGGTMTVLRVEASEPPPPAMGASTRDSETRPVRTADASTGPHTP